MDIFQDDLFKCMLLKDASQNLPSLQSLINCVRKQTSSTEESKVVYVEISSERADSRPTLITMLGKNVQNSVVQPNQKWLLVVGDAKTYDIIKSIRAEYGDQMKWLAWRLAHTTELPESSNEGLCRCWFDKAR